jgi:hypothetical protein
LTLEAAKICPTFDQLGVDIFLPWAGKVVGIVPKERSQLAADIRRTIMKVQLLAALFVVSFASSAFASGTTAPADHSATAPAAEAAPAAAKTDAAPATKSEKPMKVAKAKKGAKATKESKESKEGESHTGTH